MESSFTQQNASQEVQAMPRERFEYILDNMTVEGVSEGSYYVLHLNVDGVRMAAKVFPAHRQDDFEYELAQHSLLSDSIYVVKSINHLKSFPGMPALKAPDHGLKFRRYNLLFS